VDARPRGWLRRQQFESRPLALAFDECYGTVLQARTRRDALDAAIIELAAEPPFAEVVGRLCSLRGVSTLTALGLTVEIGDRARFRPQSLGPFLGLTPSEASSGEQRSLGAITKPETRTPADRWSKRPGTSAVRCARVLRLNAADRPAGRGPRAGRPERSPPPRPLACARRTRQTTHDRRRRRRARTRRTLLVAGDDGLTRADGRLGEESAAG